MIPLHNSTKRALSNKKKINCDTLPDVPPLGSRARPSTEREARGYFKALAKTHRDTIFNYKSQVDMAVHDT